MKYLKSFYLIFFIIGFAFSQKINFSHYHSISDIEKILNNLSNSKIAKRIILTKTLKGNNLSLVQIGNSEKGKPAILVAANMEGDLPLATEASLYLINHILNDKKMSDDYVWYIIPCGNPDAFQRYFEKPLHESNLNFHENNDDLDENIDEDGCEDLNGDGFITQMRVKDPLGEWIPIEGDSRILRRAKPERGEKGIYKLYSEGIDNDNDGLYNEDSKGGVKVGCNFPQFFRYFTSTDGKWPGSENESKSIMKFVNENKNIAMVIVFGSTNICLNKLYGGRKEEVNTSRIILNRRMAAFLNADPSQSYSLEEIIEMVKNASPPDMDVNENTVREMLGIGSFVNPLSEDVKIYEEISQKYKNFLKTINLDFKRIEPEKEKDGSFEVYSYYQLGLPTFSLDFFSIPEAADVKNEDMLSLSQIEKLSKDEFLSLGKEKIEKILKNYNAPPNINYDKIVELFKSEKMDVKKFSDLLKKTSITVEQDSELLKMNSMIAYGKKNGFETFIDWKTYKHPQLGEVEIGGFKPYVFTTPPDSLIERLIKLQVPFVNELVSLLPKIKINRVEVKSKGNGIYEIKAFIENEGYLPYPMANGIRTNKIKPIILTFNNKDIKIIDGKKRTLIKKINGKGIELVKWMVYSDKPLKLKLLAETDSALNDSYDFELRGE